MEQSTTSTTESSLSDQQYDRGRIRLSETDAAELYQALALRVDALLDTRAELIDHGFGRPGVGLVEHYNRKITSLRRAMGEVERTALEKGWGGARAVIEAYRDDPNT